MIWVHKKVDPKIGLVYLERDSLTLCRMKSMVHAFYADRLQPDAERPINKRYWPCQ